MPENDSSVILPLDKFGKFIMNNLRDRAIDHYDTLSNGKCKAPSLRQIQAELNQFNEEQKNIIRTVIFSCVGNGIHDLLFALQEAHDNNEKIDVFVDGVNVAEVSDGLQGELFTKNGWYHRFSKFGLIGEE
ncbi:hypothetical protein [Paenibacillus harenae]|uniref:hypothetical protein n=1 Tax=Paenibacillus harenae TaxID=306543 RepID=UPI00278D7027|nr:hypothetical protein [Paenibacillus harenae]MDQ0062696.1 hypothetical protein [Paenibacillus harenae]